MNMQYLKKMIRMAAFIKTRIPKYKIEPRTITNKNIVSSKVP